MAMDESMAIFFGRLFNREKYKNCNRNKNTHSNTRFIKNKDKNQI
jgi:hypothetical protein